MEAEPGPPGLALYDAQVLLLLATAYDLSRQIGAPHVDDITNRAA